MAEAEAPSTEVAADAGPLSVGMAGEPVKGKREIHVYLFRAQSAAYLDMRREVMLHGPRGSGKTRTMCLIAVRHATIPGNLVILGRKFGADLRQTTLRTLLQPAGATPAVLPPGTYDINWAARQINVKGGGTILWMGLDEESRLGSYEPGCIAIDEAREITEEDYLMILGGMRNAADPNPQLVLATNPAGRAHFLYEKFQPERPEDRHPLRGCHFLPMTENTTLSAQYVQTMGDMPGNFRERFFLGKWGEFEGLVLANWDRGVHMVERPPEDMAIWFVGIDDGYTNPFCAVLCGEDSLGRYHVFAEVHGPRMLEQQKVDRVLAMLDKFGVQDKVEAIYADPAAAGIIGALRNVQLPMVRGNNDVLEGIGKVQTRLGIDSTLKSPMLTISPKCRQVIAEIEGYTWYKNSQNQNPRDEPVKQADHGPDAIRYAVASRDKNPIHVHVMGEFEEAERVDPLDPDREAVLIPERAGWCRTDNEAIWETF